MEEEKKEINEEMQPVQPLNNEKDDMYSSLKRSNSKRAAVIVVLVFVILIMLVLVILYYFNNKDTKEGGNNGGNNVVTPTSTPAATPVESQNDNLPEWANYLLNQNITDITYGYAKYDENGVPQCSTTSMTKDQLKMVFEEMTKSNLKKFDMGGAGKDCDIDGIQIKYGSKVVNILGGQYFYTTAKNGSDDSKLISLLEKAVNTNESAQNETPFWMFQYEWDINYINTVLGIQ